MVSSHAAPSDDLCYSAVTMVISFALSVLLILTPLTSFAQNSGDLSGKQEDGASGVISSRGDGTTQEQEEFSQEEEGDLDTSLASESETGVVASFDTKRPSVSKHDGSLVYEYAIEVPEGRNGLTPNHSLIYRSSNRKPDNILGFGWEVNIPYIERSTKKGSNNIYVNDEYISSLDEELSAQAGGIYKPRVEKGSFRKYQKIGDYWLVTNKQGTKYYFGQTPQARQDGTVKAATQIVRWLLEKVEDTNGNTVTYVYYKDKGQIYPNRINYANTSNTDYAYSIRFNRVTRTDKTKMYDKGFPVTTDYLLGDIDIYKGTEKILVYKITLESITDPKVGHLITSIHKEGKRDDGTWTSGPATTFSYDMDVAYVESPLYNSSEGGYSGLVDYSGEVTMVDVNADSLPDYLHRDSVEDVTINTGTGWAHGSNLPAARNWITTFRTSDGRRRSKDRYTNIWYIVDYDGDYSPEVQAELGRGGRYGTHWFTASSTRGLYTSIDDPNVIKSSRNHRYYRPHIQDINNDGLIDFVGVNSRSSRRPIEIPVFVNVGGTSSLDFTSESTATNTADFSIPHGSSRYDSRRGISYVGSLQDVNGDNLPEMHSSYRDSSTRKTRPIHFTHTGFGWDRTRTEKPSLHFNDTTTIVGSLYFGSYIDYNKDGLPDLLVRYEGRGNPEYSGIYLYTKHDAGYRYSQKYNQHHDTYNSYVDINADGILDYYQKREDGRNGQKRYYFLGQHRLELNKITTEYGGTYEFTYDGVASHDSSNKVPFPLRVVTEVAYKDAYATDWKETVTYKGGSFYHGDVYDKKFAGFETVEVVNGNKKEKTYYHQHNGVNATYSEPADSYAKISLPYKMEVYEKRNNSDSNYKTVTYTYGEVGNGTNSTFVYLTDEKQTLHKEGSLGFGQETAQTSSYTYDTYGNVLTETKKAGITVVRVLRKQEYVYRTPDTTNYIVALPIDVQTKDGSNTLIARVQYTYDSNGNLLTERYHINGTGSVIKEKTYTHNTKGQVLTEKDSFNNTITYVYDADSLNIVTETNPKGHVTRYEYNNLGNVTKEIDPNGFEVKYVYDGIGRVTAVQKKRNMLFINTVQYVYDFSRRPYLVKETKNYGDTDMFVYTYFDGFGRDIQTVYSNGILYNVNGKTYNNQGLVEHAYTPYQAVTSAYNPVSSSTAKTTTTYDVLGRVVSIATPVGTTTLTYEGDTVEITSPENRVKRLEYDAYGRLKRVFEKEAAQFKTTTYTYDSLDRMTQTEDADDNIRTLTYDFLGRTLNVSDLHDSNDTTYKTKTFAYNQEYRTSETKQDGTVISYTYDTLGRVLTEDRTAVAGVDYTFTYDTCENGKGSLCSVTGLDGVSVAYKYDKEGNVKEEAKTIAGTAYTTTYEHNLQNGLKRVTLPNAKTLTYVFGSNGDVSVVKVDNSVFQTVTYGPFNTVKTQTAPNGAREVNTYDNLGRLTRKKITSNDSVIARQLDYTYDRDNNVTRIADTNNTNQVLTKTYTYDALNRITQASAIGITGKTYTKNYTYDSIGNIKSKTGVGAYTYVADGDVTFKTPHQVSTIGTTIYTYDLNGNLTSNGTHTITRDYRDRAHTVAKDTDTYTYLYDHEGGRVKETKGTQETIYVNPYYTVDNGSEEVHVLLNGVAIGSSATTDTIHTQCALSGSNALVNLALGTGWNKRTNMAGGIEVYRGSDSAVTMSVNDSHPFCVLNENNHLYTDHAGSTILAIDDSDHSVQQFLDYYPYGEESINEQGTDGFDSLHTHTGNVTDSTGLIYRNARYYDPNIGRFVSKDPVTDYLGDPAGFEALTGMPLVSYLTNPQAHNTYSYALNNPTTYTDKEGAYVETALDLAFLSYSLHEYHKNPSTANAIYVGLDGLGVVIPFAAGIGTFTKGAIGGAKQWVRAYKKYDERYSKWVRQKHFPPTPPSKIPPKNIYARKRLEERFDGDEKVLREIFKNPIAVYYQGGGRYLYMHKKGVAVYNHKIKWHVTEYARGDFYRHTKIAYYHSLFFNITDRLSRYIKSLENKK